MICFCFFLLLFFVSPGFFLAVLFTKASEASWSYSCDSKVSFDRVQILTPDLSGRSPPPPLPTSPLPTSPSPPPCLPPSLPPPSSQVRLRPVVALWHAVSVAYLAAALAHSHSHSHSHSHCLSLSHLSHLSLLSLSLSPLCLSSFRLSSLAGGSGQRATYKGLFTWNRLPRPTCARRPAFCYSVRLPPKRAPCFFLPRCPPLSHSGALAFAPPLGLKSFGGCFLPCDLSVRFVFYCLLLCFFVVFLVSWYTFWVFCSSM